MRSSSSVQYYGIAGASSQRLREEEGFHLYQLSLRFCANLLTGKFLNKALAFLLLVEAGTEEVFW